MSKVAKGSLQAFFVPQSEKSEKSEPSELSQKSELSELSLDNPHFVVFF